jgi:hypothetical protein
MPYFTLYGARHDDLEEIEAVGGDLGATSRGPE